MPFLSLLDERAKPKGSRDPLGFELVWSSFGRKVIGNLTTITSSMDNFAVTLLGFYYANQLVSAGVKEGDRHHQIRDWFLRYEQLTGYIRYYGHAPDIMGITRVKRRIDEDKRITLGLHPDQQILSDQASYGLWGLYSSAARDTGLIHGNDRQVTSVGERIVESIITELGDTAKVIRDLMQFNGRQDTEQLNRIAPALMKAIHHESVQKPLLEALMSGNAHHGLQKEIWTITRSIFSQDGHPKNVPELVAAALACKPSKSLSDALHDIIDIERLLVTINTVFHYCRLKDGVGVDEVLNELKGRNYSYLPVKVPAGDFSRRDRLASILSAFHEGNMARVLRESLLLNKSVMQDRGGAPWVEIESGKNVLRVKVRNEKVTLRNQDDLEQAWDYDYFLGSFLIIAEKQLVPS